MVDLYFYFFRFPPAMEMVFNLSYIPQPEDFKELTPDQYQAMYRKVSEEDLKNLDHKRVLAFLPDDPRVYNRVCNLYGDNLVIVTSEEASTFASVEKLIEKLCNDSGREFKTLTDKLVYMAQTLPEEFSENTPYAIHRKIRNLRKR